MSVHLASAEEMLRYLNVNFGELRSLYFECEKNITVTTELRIKSYQYLMNCRSVFEYCAQEIAVFTNNVKGKIYFPIIRPPNTKTEFSIRMKNWFPFLEEHHKQFYELFERFQYFNSNSWILAMVDITNESKHISLSFQESRDCEALVIMAPYKTSIQLGDRGLSKIDIGEGGKLIFEQPNGRPLSIRGPQILSLKTEKLLDADPEIILAKRKWREIKFDKYTDQPALVLLAKSAGEANNLYFETAKLIGRNRPDDLVWPLRLS